MRRKNSIFATTLCSALVAATVATSMPVNLLTVEAATTSISWEDIVAEKNKKTGEKTYTLTVEVGQSFRLSDYVQVGKESKASNRSDFAKNATYKTSNKKIATISKTGYVKPVKAGSAVLKVTYEGKSIRLKLNVVNETKYSNDADVKAINQAINALAKKYKSVSDITDKNRYEFAAALSDIYAKVAALEAKYNEETPDNIQLLPVSIPSFASMGMMTEAYNGVAGIVPEFDLSDAGTIQTKTYAFAAGDEESVYNKYSGDFVTADEVFENTASSDYINAATTLYNGKWYQKQKADKYAEVEYANFAYADPAEDRFKAENVADALGKDTVTNDEIVKYYQESVLKAVGNGQSIYTTKEWEVKDGEVQYKDVNGREVTKDEKSGDYYFTDASGTKIYVDGSVSKVDGKYYSKATTGYKKVTVKRKSSATSYVYTDKNGKEKTISNSRVYTEKVDGKTVYYIEMPVDLAENKGINPVLSFGKGQYEKSRMDYGSDVDFINAAIEYNNEIMAIEKGTQAPTERYMAAFNEVYLNASVASPMKELDENGDPKKNDDEYVYVPYAPSADNADYTDALYQPLKIAFADMNDYNDFENVVDNFDGSSINVMNVLGNVDCDTTRGVHRITLKKDGVIVGYSEPAYDESGKSITIYKDANGNEVENITDYNESQGSYICYYLNKGKVVATSEREIDGNTTKYVYKEGNTVIAFEEKTYSDSENKTVVKDANGAEIYTLTNTIDSEGDCIKTVAKNKYQNITIDYEKYQYESNGKTRTSTRKSKKVVETKYTGSKMNFFGKFGNGDTAVYASKVAESMNRPDFTIKETVTYKHTTGEGGSYSSTWESEFDYGQVVNEFNKKVVEYNNEIRDIENGTKAPTERYMAAYKQALLDTYGNEVTLDADDVKKIGSKYTEKKYKASDFASLDEYVTFLTYVNVARKAVSESVEKFDGTVDIETVGAYLQSPTKTGYFTEAEVDDDGNVLYYYNPKEKKYVTDTTEVYVQENTTENNRLVISSYAKFADLVSLFSEYKSQVNAKTFTAKAKSAIKPTTATGNGSGIVVNLKNAVTKDQLFGGISLYNYNSVYPYVPNYGESTQYLSYADFMKAGDATLIPVTAKVEKLKLNKNNKLVVDKDYQFITSYSAKEYKYNIDFTYKTLDKKGNTVDETTTETFAMKYRPLDNETIKSLTCDNGKSVLSNMTANGYTFKDANQIATPEVSDFTVQYASSSASFVGYINAGATSIAFTPDSRQATAYGKGAYEKVDNSELYMFEELGDWGASEYFNVDNFGYYFEPGAYRITILDNKGKTFTSVDFMVQ